MGYTGKPERYDWHGRIHYIHRTARDYIERDDVWNSTLKRTAGTNFCLDESSFRSGVLKVKIFTTTPGLASFPRIYQIARTTMTYAKMLENKTSRPSTDWLDTLDQAMSDYHKTDCHAGHPCADHDLLFSLSAIWGKSFLSLAIEYDLIYYVKRKLESDPALTRKKKGRPLPGQD